MSDKFIIKGGFPLHGEVEISGSKNAAGPLLAATLLSNKKCTISNLPKISDVLNLIEVIRIMGAEVKWQGEKTVSICAKNINPEKIPAGVFEKARMSVLLIGPLLGRFPRFKIPHPGGDKIGVRPITTHLEGLAGLGAKVKNTGQFYCFERPNILKGAKIVLKEFSVTATENVIMAAALAKGKTTIDIAAAEPHVEELGNFLAKMGIKISGQGTHRIEIEGNQRLSTGANWTIPPDYIEAGTFLIAFAVTNSQGKIKNVRPNDLVFFLDKIKEIGINFKIQGKNIIIAKSKELKATKVQVLPHPGFPTDLQPQTCLLLTQCLGKSLVHDPLYENRFSHLYELRKMGADIEITDPHRALIFGKSNLLGTKVDGTDIRSTVTLILAGLIAKGETLVSGAEQVDRGYENIEQKLQKLGAKIKRIKEN
ncbi:MAG: UDP-N-acetylglucosamine 1-carboxyvinyltransferase [bacterium]|nr:UDP-N-acetylglucosamine 1-carboxyvinyltransferase [bacterium]